MNPTLKDIAEYCGINKSTVYRALSGKGRINAETMGKVQAAAKLLGYSSAGNRAARRMAAVRLNRPYLNDAIAILLPRDFYLLTYYQRIHAGLLSSLSQARQDVFTAQLDESSTRLPSAIAAGEVDAVICVGNATTQTFLALERTKSTPMVTLATVSPEHASVTTDENLAGFLAAEHLLRLGHRRIMHFFPKHTFYPASQRISGFHEASRKLGLKPEDVFVEICRSNDLPHAEWIVHYLEQALAEFPDITAFIASNDNDARVIYDVLSQKGYDIPSDFSLIGCDNTVQISDARGQNILTTIDLSLEQISQKAASLVIDLAKGQTIKHYHSEVSGQLVSRSSTTAPRKQA